MHKISHTYQIWHLPCKKLRYLDATLSGDLPISPPLYFSNFELCWIALGLYLFLMFAFIQETSNCEKKKIFSWTRGTRRSASSCYQISLLPSNAKTLTLLLHHSCSFTRLRKLVSPAKTWWHMKPRPRARSIHISSLHVSHNFFLIFCNHWLDWKYYSYWSTDCSMHMWIIVLMM